MRLNRAAAGLLCGRVANFPVVGPRSPKPDPAAQLENSSLTAFNCSTLGFNFRVVANFSFIRAELATRGFYVLFLDFGAPATITASFPVTGSRPSGNYRRPVVSAASLYSCCRPGTAALDGALMP
jgi:hypothetical protein